MKFFILFLLFNLFFSPLFAKGKRPPAVDEEDSIQFIEEKATGEVHEATDGNISDPTLDPDFAIQMKELQDSIHNSNESENKPQNEQGQLKATNKNQQETQEKSKAEKETTQEQVETLQPQNPAKIVNEFPSEIPANSKVHQVWIWQETQDCLWQIAKEYYGDPWKWKKIYLANRNNILNPAIIFPKQRIIVPPIEEN